MARRKRDDSHAHGREASIRGREEEGRKALIVRVEKRTRVATTGPDPDRTALPGTEELLNTADVVDVRHVHDVTMGKRKVLTLPADLCRRFGIGEGTPLRIIEYEGRFEVTPMRLFRPLKIARRRLRYSSRE